MLLPLMITTMAGLCTGCGGLLALVLPVGPGLLRGSMGFAAGVMVTVSLADLLPAALAAFCLRLPSLAAGGVVCSLLAVGMAVAALLDGFIPQKVGTTLPGDDRRAALRTALVVGAALVLHNLPEGVLTLFSGMADPRLGGRMALAIALHNIPEGIAVAAPLYYATRSRARALAAAFASGLAEPLGAVAAWLFLHRWLTLELLDGVLVGVAGIMLWVAAAQLLPQAFNRQNAPWAGALGLVGGVLCMLFGVAALT